MLIKNGNYVWMVKPCQQPRFLFESMYRDGVISFDQFLTRDSKLVLYTNTLVHDAIRCLRNELYVDVSGYTRCHRG